MSDKVIENQSDTEQPEDVKTTEVVTEEGKSDADTDKEANKIGYLTRRLEKLEKQAEKPAEEPKPVSKEEETSDDETDFKIYNAGEIRLCKDEFKSYRQKGYDLEDSLRLAKLDKGITEKDTSGAERQAAISSDVETSNRASKEEVEVDDELVEMAGSKEKAVKLKKKYGHLVKGVK